MPVCRRIASLNCVYAIWADPNSSQFATKFEVVLTPGAKAADLAPKLEAILSSQPRTPHLNSIEVEIWTYHDPTESSDFRQMISSPFSDPPSFLGFPDYRGIEVLELDERFDPLVASASGIWAKVTVPPRRVE